MTDPTQARPGGGLARGFAAIDRTLAAVETAVMAAVVAGLFVIMAFVAADAALRYSLNRPLIFSYDLVQMYLLPAVMLLPAGYVLRRGGHISVDLFALMMPERLRRLLFGITLLAAAPVFGIMVWRIAGTTRHSYEAGLVTTGMINWPIWAHEIVFVFVTLGIVLRLVHLGLADLVAFATGREGISISILPAHDDPLEESV